MFGTACAESVSAGGLGNLTLGGALIGHRSLNSVFSNDTTDAGIYFQYAIEDTADAWETGVGHLSAATTFVRDWMEASSTGAALNVSTTAKVRATPIGAGLVPTMPTIPASIGNRIEVSAQYGGFSTAAYVADSLRYILHHHEVMAPVDAIVFEVTVAGAALTKAACGIYSIGADGNPKRKIVNGAEVAVDTTGIKASTFTSRLLPPGWYALALVSSGAPTVRTISQTHGGSPWGRGVTLNLSTTRAGEAFTYSATLPVAAGAFSYNDNTGSPLLGLRIG